MFSHRILHRPRSTGPTARVRRPRVGRSLQVESLENRTPLAAGSGAGIGTIVVFQAVEIGNFVPGRPLALQSVALRIADVQQTIAPIPSIPSWDVATNLPTSASEVPSAPNTLEEFLSNAPSDDAGAPTTLALGAGWSLALGPAPVPAQWNDAASIPGLPLPDLSSGQTVAVGFIEGVIFTSDHIDGGSDLLSSLLQSDLGVPTVSAASILAAETDLNDEGSDMSDGGPVQTIESFDGSSTLTTPTLGSGSSVALGSTQVPAQWNSEPKIAEPPLPDLSNGGTVVEGLVGGTLLKSNQANDGSAFYSFLLQSPGIPRGLNPGLLGSQTNLNSEESDMIMGGPMETVGPVDGFSTSMSTALATGRAVGREMNSFVADPSLQLDSSSEDSNTNGLFYLASGAWSTGASDGSLALEENSTEPFLPGPITAGGVSLNILLADPDVPIRTEPDRLEQVAELVPLPETSLALAATLWTVPSDSPTSGAQSDLSSATATDSAAPLAAPSSSVNFVIGMDQALEQTYRDIREGMLYSHDGPPGIESPPGGEDELLDWHAPILPAGRGGSPVNETGSARTGGTGAFGEAGRMTLQSHEESPPDSHDGSPVALWAAPMISVVSVSTVIAGWFWNKRQRLRRLGFGGAKKPKGRA
jgi:hypothetical protein